MNKTKTSKSKIKSNFLLDQDFPNMNNLFPEKSSNSVSRKKSFSSHVIRNNLKSSELTPNNFESRHEVIEGKF